MKKLLILIVLFSVLISNLYSQNKTIIGRIISNRLDEDMIGVQIMVNDTVKVGETDIKGFFHIDIPISVKKISFDYVGFERTNIWLEDKCNKIEVVMMWSGGSCFATLKRLEAERKKNYKKLPKIHKQAYEKGIFETEYACYMRKFEPFYLK